MTPALQRSMIARELKGKTYGLTVPPTNEVANVNGDLDVSGGGPITVVGVDNEATTIQNLNAGGEGAVAAALPHRLSCLVPAVWG